MTYTEIIKALGKDMDLIGLIDRQQAEIERLKKDCADIDNFARALCYGRLLKGKAVADFEDLQEYIRKQKSEAVKEFAERLKDKSLTKWDYHEAVDVEEIDNLVKEMVGED